MCNWIKITQNSREWKLLRFFCWTFLFHTHLLSSPSLLLFILLLFRRSRAIIHQIPTNRFFISSCGEVFLLESETRNSKYLNMKFPAPLFSFRHHYRHGKSRKHNCGVEFDKRPRRTLRTDSYDSLFCWLPNGLMCLSRFKVKWCSDNGENYNFSSTQTRDNEKSQRENFERFGRFGNVLR